jgi:hypothetical protein
MTPLPIKDAATVQEKAKAAVEWIEYAYTRTKEKYNAKYYALELLRPLASGESVIVPVEHTKKMMIAGDCPQPVLEKVLSDKMPDWFEDFFPYQSREGAWKELVTLTRRPVRKQRWAIPDWDDLPDIKNGALAIIGLMFSQEQYNDMKNFIHSLKEDKK